MSFTYNTLNQHPKIDTEFVSEQLSMQFTVKMHLIKNFTD